MLEEWFDIVRCELSDIGNNGNHMHQNHALEMLGTNTFNLISKTCKLDYFLISHAQHTTHVYDSECANALLRSGLIAVCFADTAVLSSNSTRNSETGPR